MFNITGKVVAVSELQTRGQFDFVEFVVETERDVNGTVYKDVYAFTLGGKSLDSTPKPTIGDVSNIKFNIRSKEYNGKYYTSLNVYGIEVKEAAPQQKSSRIAPKQEAVSEGDDDLPF